MLGKIGHTGSGDDTVSIIAAFWWRSAEIGGAERVGAGAAARVAERLVSDLVNDGLLTS